jgi:hypothetical protein
MRVRPAAPAGPCLGAHPACWPTTMAMARAARTAWLGTARPCAARCTARSRPQRALLSTAPPAVPITELTLLRYSCVRPRPPPPTPRSYPLPAQRAPLTEPAHCWRRYVEGMLDKRGDVEDPASPRAGHINHAKAALASGDLLIAGALADPVDEALFIWRGGAEAEAAAKEFGK